jgi:hypothetical protein
LDTYNPTVWPVRVTHPGPSASSVQSYQRLQGQGPEEHPHSVEEPQNFLYNLKADLRAAAAVGWSRRAARLVGARKSVVGAELRVRQGSHLAAMIGA